MAEKLSTEELVEKILAGCGGKANIQAAMNCMTRLRIYVANDGGIDETSLKAIPGVMGVVHDRAAYIEVVVGPGTARKCADFCAEMGIPASAPDGKAGTAASSDWQANKAAIKAGQKESRLKNMLKIFGSIFVPLIPGVIAAGICAGLSSVITNAVPAWKENSALLVINNILSFVNTAFMTYLVAWAGYRAAEQFGATPILGGMLGMITTMGGINDISKVVGLYNDAQPLNAILRAGRGGVLAAVIGVWILSKVEKSVRKRMPGAFDIVFTPILTLIICVVPYIFVIMPLTGIVSTGLCKIVEVVCMNQNPAVRLISGFLGSALFLPMVAMGMHHGLVALYTVQLETFGYVTLYPALAMAGAGQVGAAIAIWLKCKKCGNSRLQSVIDGALPAGILGVGEPLIYGVTLPMGKPFITAGLGAGFGGAFAMLTQCAATAWGPSGLLGLFVMNAGPHAGTMSLVYYFIGLCISYIGGFVVTNAFVSVDEVAQA